MITSGSGGARLLGFEIQVPERASFFLILEDGLTVLYGKNGVGKSTILSAIENFYRGVEPGWRSAKPVALAYYELVDAFGEQATEMLTSHVLPSDPLADDHFLPPGSDRQVLAPEPGGMRYWHDHFGSVGKPPVEKLVEQYVKNLIERFGEGAPKHFVEQMVETRVGGSPDRKSFPLLNLLVERATRAFSYEPVAPDEEIVRGWPMWFLAYLRSAAARDLATRHEVHVLDGLESLATAEDFREVAEMLAIEAPSESEQQGSNGFVYGRLWDELARGLLFRLLQRQRFHLDGINSARTEPAAHLLAEVGRAVEEFVGSRLVRISASGTEPAPAWTYTLCARSDPGSGAASSLYRQQQPNGGAAETAAKNDVLTGLVKAMVDLDQAESDREASIRSLADARSLLREARAQAVEENDEQTVTEIDSYLHNEQPTNDPGVPDADVAPVGPKPTPASTGSRSDHYIEELIGSLFGGPSILPGVVVSDASFTGTALPFDLCDLRQTLDIDCYIKELFAAALWVGELSFTNVVDKPGGRYAPVESELASEGIRRLCDHIENVGRELARIDIGISGLRLVVSEDVREWLAEHPYRFEAQDAPSHDWVPVSALSSAQQKWLGHLLRLQHSLKGRFPLLVLADEPEAGVHASAAKSALDYLSALPVTTLAASHAPAALRMPDANLQLVDRDFHGMISLGKVRSGGDVRTAAVRLGATPMDLLGAKRLLVYVEGAHDEAAVNSLLGASSDPGLTERVLVAPARGVENFGGVAGSLIVSDFTDLQILVVADNFNIETLELARAALIELAREGVNHRIALERIDFENLSKVRSLEARVLWDLLARANERGTLHRVHFFGLNVPDIQEAFPSRAFGLKQDWAELRAEHAEATRPRADSRNTTPKGFKPWLRETRGVTISATSIVRAFEGLDEIPDELRRLLAAIEKLARPNAATAL